MVRFGLAVQFLLGKLVQEALVRISGSPLSSALSLSVSSPFTLMI